MVQGSNAEWSNIPKLVANYCIHTQAHLSAIISYLAEKHKDESTQALRIYVAGENDGQNNRFNTFKIDTDSKLENLFDLNKEINSKNKTLNKDVQKLKTYLDAFKQDTVKEIFQIENDEDYKNDNEEKSMIHENDILRFGEVTEEYNKKQEKLKEIAKKNGQYFAPIPNNFENELLKVRMVNFQQLYDFNNLCLNKSYVKKRTKINEDKIAKLQADVKNLFEWREDLEKRMKD